MSQTNFQRHLDKKYESDSSSWKNQLHDLSWGGDFSVADAEGFFEATTAKSVSRWAISTEIKVRHDSLKKIIDSV